jgi:drug/metabolite transporter (DMT)-like permease
MAPAEPNHRSDTKPLAWQTLLAFAIIYFVWGSTFLAIRVGVREVPPLLFAAMRFFVAGAALFGWVVVKRERLPNLREWISAAALGFIIFVLDYGCLFWAEQRVPSGIAAVMLATIPAFIAVAEVLILRTLRFSLQLGIALLIGICGVAVLMSRSVSLGGEAIDRMGAAALIFAAASWSIATVMTRKLALPHSKMVSSAAQMLTGGAFLVLASAALGEFRGFDPGAISRTAWISLAYLIVAGSIVGFTAYVWLIHHQSPTKVGTYAYVNPVVAVLVGYFFGAEPLGLRTVLGSIFVLLSVIVITTLAPKKAQPQTAVKEAEQTATARP